MGFRTKEKQKKDEIQNNGKFYRRHYFQIEKDLVIGIILSDYSNIILSEYYPIHLVIE